MKNVRKLSGVANPGWSFTEDRLIQLEEMYSIIKGLSADEIYTYKKIQNIVKKNSKIVDDSKVRMFFPHLIDLGFLLNNYDLKTMFSKRGKEFLEYVIPLYLHKDELAEEPKKKIEEIFSEYLAWGYQYLISKDFPLDKHKETQRVYKMLPVVVSELGYIFDTQMEVFFIIDKLKKNKSIEEIKLELLDDFRKIESPKEVFEIANNVNARGYILSFLEQAKILEGKKYNGRKILMIGINGGKYFDLKRR